MGSCTFCGTENEPSARFCIGCGAGLAGSCSSCGTSLPTTAHFCPECGAEATEVQVPSGMLRIATVVFADIFGPLGEAPMDAEYQRALLQSYFEAMSQEIRHEDGTIEKFIGDAIVAIFGAPATHEDDPIRAVRAATRMLSRFDLWKEEQGISLDLAMKIGINTGEVFSTEVANDDSLVTGDAVNVAARLQQGARPGSIVVGERTARAIRSQFDLESLESLSLKGKSAPVPAWLVRTEREEGAPRGLPGVMAPMIGRDGELEIMRAVWNRVTTDRSPHLATIIGEPGVGKTRLLSEFAETLGTDARLLAGRCLPYGESVTFRPLGEILSAETGVLESDPPDLALEKIDKLVESIRPHEPHDRQRRSAALASTLGLALEDGPLASLDPGEVLRELVIAWRELLMALAEDQPLVMVIEDIHWADPTMLDVLEELAAFLEGPVLILCATRPELLEGRGGWGAMTRNHSLLWLDPLSPEESAQLMEIIVDLETFPSELADRMLERSEGNPFFLEEIVRRLIDEGHLEQEKGRWRVVGEIHDVDVPDNVHSVILSRMDLLTPEERNALQQAAVIGRIFWLGALEELVPQSSLKQNIKTLQKRQFVMQRLNSSMAGEAEFTFKHILTRDVAYESLPRRSRGIAHEAIAVWIEQQSGGRDELAELLLHHYERAFSCRGDDHLRQRARECSLVASHSALRRFAIKAAEDFGQRAVDLSKEGTERIEAREALGDLCHLTLRGDKAWTAYLDALGELQSDDDEWFRRLAAKAAVVPTRWWGSMEKVPPKEQVQQLIEGGLAAAGPEPSRDRSLLLTSKAFSQMMGFVEKDESGLAAAREALEIAESIDDPDLMSASMDALSNWLLPEGSYGEIERIHERRVALVPRLRNVKEICDAYAMAAYSSLHSGHYRRCVEHASACIARARGVDAANYVHGLVWRVCGRFMIGDWTGCLEDQSEIERLGTDAAPTTPPPYVMRAYAIAMLCRQMTGDLPKANAYLEILTRFHSDAERSANHAGSLAAMARTLTHRGEPDRAISLLRSHRSHVLGAHLEAFCEAVAGAEDWSKVPEILDLASKESERGGLTALPAFADRLRGREALATGDLEQARTALERSVATFGSLEAPWERAFSQLWLADTFRSLGDEPAAQELAEEARAVFERLGSVREESRAGDFLRPSS